MVKREIQSLLFFKDLQFYGKLNIAGEETKLLWPCVVGVLWGVTNPLLKRGSAGIDRVESDNFITKFISELRFLFTNWRYLVPFMINQCGSLLYYFTLGSTSLKFAVPITNSVAFVATAVTGWLLGESVPKRNTVIGSLLVLLGSACYILDNS